MVVRYLLIWLALAVSTPTCAQATESTLTVSVPVTAIQWGQPLRATLHYRGEHSLEAINLKVWQAFVAISDKNESSDVDSEGRDIQVLRLRLYPRRTGAYTLPRLTLGDARSQPVSLNIRPAVVERHPVKLVWQLSSLSPWQGEAVIVHVQLWTTDYAAHVRLDVPKQPQFLSRPLKTQRHLLADGSYRFDTGWILYPAESGAWLLDLPPVRYQLSGGDRRRFYLPLQPFQVKALPTYLPPTLPVGPLAIRSKIDKGRWQISVRTRALIPYGVPGLDAQLAAISNHDIADIKIQHTQRSAYNDYGDSSLYSVPLPDWLMPFGKDRTLTLRYFNPATGRIEEITHNLPRHWEMPVWARWLLVLSVLAIAALLARFIRPGLERQISRLVLRRALRKATSVMQLRRIMLDHYHYVTLSEWVKKAPAQESTRKKIIQQLNSACFSASGYSDIQYLKAGLLKLD